MSVRQAYEKNCEVFLSTQMLLYQKCIHLFGPPCIFCLQIFHRAQLNENQRNTCHIICCRFAESVAKGELDQMKFTFELVNS